MLLLENNFISLTTLFQEYPFNNIGYAEVSDGNLSDAPMPETASTPKYIMVKAGGNFSVALKDDGTVTAWGQNNLGQCDVPKDLCDVIDIQAGFYHCAALKKDGSVVVWGSNHARQLKIPEGLCDVRAISANCNHTLAVTESGKVVAWGNNDNGQCNIPENISGVKYISALLFSSILVQDDGKVICLGQQLDVPDMIDIKQLDSGWFHTLGINQDKTVSAWGDKTSNQCAIPNDIHNAKQVDGGWLHSLALTDDGEVIPWGDNTYGQCTVPKDLKDVIFVSAGYTHSLALKSDGTVVGWGSNLFGECTQETSSSKYRKINLLDMYKNKQISVSVYPPLNPSIDNCIDGNDYSFAYAQDVWSCLSIQFSFQEPQNITEIRTLVGKSSLSYLSSDWYIEAADNSADINIQDGTYINVTDYIKGDGSWYKLDFGKGIKKKVWRFNINKINIDTRAYVSEIEMYTSDDLPTPVVSYRNTPTNGVNPTITSTPIAYATPTATETVTATSTANFNSSASHSVPVSNGQSVNLPTQLNTMTPTPSPTPINNPSTQYPGAQFDSNSTKKPQYKIADSEKPDLIITNIACFPQNPNKNDHVNLNVQIKNAGKMDIKEGQAVIINFYANDSGKLVGSSKFIEGIPAGKSINLLSYKNNGGGFIAKEPIYKVTAIVDYHNNIEEANENNNSLAKRIFRDVPANHWAKKEIEELVSKSIISGKSSLYTFCPNDCITRAELATALVKMLGIDTSDKADISLPFNDTKTNAWYYKYVLAAYKNGLIMGKSKYSFNPEDKISRQDIAVILKRALEKYPGNTDLKNDVNLISESSNNDTETYLSKFKDSQKISAYARQGVASMVKYNLIHGKDDGRIYPLSNITRAEAAILLFRCSNF